MIGRTAVAPFIVEPYDSVRHDRAVFSCGVEQVDNFFKMTADKLANADNLRMFVLADAMGALIGFYALNAHSVDYRDLPAKFARTRPGHGMIPAAFISMIGVDERFQGKGFGGDLLVDELRRIAQVADQQGIPVIMLDVLDCGEPDRVAKRKLLYHGDGFEPLSSNPHRMFPAVATVRGLSECS